MTNSPERNISLFKWKEMIIRFVFGWNRQLAAERLHSWSPSQDDRTRQVHENLHAWLGIVVLRKSQLTSQLQLYKQVPISYLNILSAISWSVFMYKASSMLVLVDGRDDVLDCFDKNLPHILTGWYAVMWSAGVVVGWRTEEKRSHVSRLELWSWNILRQCSQITFLQEIIRP